MPSQKPSLTVRIPGDIKRTLEEIALKKDRSLSSMVTVILREFFEKNCDDKKAVDFLNDSELNKLKSLSLNERQAIIDQLSIGDK